MRAGGELARKLETVRARERFGTLFRNDINLLRADAAERIAPVYYNKPAGGF